jgi:hypothetical protein
MLTDKKQIARALQNLYIYFFFLSNTGKYPDKDKTIKLGITWIFAYYLRVFTVSVKIFFSDFTDKF